MELNLDVDSMTCVEDGKWTRYAGRCLLFLEVSGGEGLGWNLLPVWPGQLGHSPDKWDAQGNFLLSIDLGSNLSY